MKDFFPHSQYLSLSWPSTLAYTESTSDQARTPEVHKDFSKKSSYSANARQALTFCDGPQITWGLMYYFRSELPKLQLI